MMSIPIQRRASVGRRSGWAPFWVLAVVAMWLGGCAGLGLGLDMGVLPNGADAATAGESDYGRGKQALAAGRLGLAIVHFRAELDGAPESVDAWNGLGAAFDRLGRFDLSLRAYGRALAIDPRSAQTLNNLGYSLLLQGRFEQAAAYLRDAEAQGGGDARILKNRRLVEDSLVRASGAVSRGVDATTASGPQAAGTGFRPRLQRIGKATKRLVTRPPPESRARAPSRAPDHRPGARIMPGNFLPTFLAAPMALEPPRAMAPATGGAASRSGGT